MAQTTQEFFETAIQRSGCINASGFARRIGVSTRAPYEWKTGRSYPSDKTMLKIALLCDLDPAEALALLNLWRCDESAKTAYAALLDFARKAAKNVSAFIIACLFALQASDANALNYNDNRPASVSHNSSQCDDYAIIGATLRKIGRNLARALQRLFICGISGEPKGVS